MARRYQRENIAAQREEQRSRAVTMATLASAGTLGLVLSPLLSAVPPLVLAALGLIPAAALTHLGIKAGENFLLESERARESERRGGKQVLNGEMLAVLRVTGDHVATIGENIKTLIFPLAELPEMGNAGSKIVGRIKVVAPEREDDGADNFLLHPRDPAFSLADASSRGFNILIGCSEVEPISGKRRIGAVKQFGQLH